MGEKMKIAIIIINYNNYEKTIECINSIIKEDQLCHYDIYILDNSSINDSYQILNKQFNSFDNIKIYESEKNLGYANGNNMILNMIENQDYNYVLISNNDIIYFSKSINILLETIKKDKNIIMVCPKIINTNNKVQISIKKNKISYFNYILYILGIKGKKINDKLLNKTHEVYWCSGCCFLIDIKKFKDLGYFDPNTFLYFEEYILSSKIEKEKYKIVFNPAAKVLHFHKASTSRKNIDIALYFLESELYYWYRYRNITKFKLKIILLLRRFIIFFKFNKIDYKKYILESKQIFDKTLKKCGVKE